MTPPKRRWPFRDDLFDELNREFEEMERNIGRVFEEMKRVSIETEGEEGPSYVYGFSLRVGPDGRPHVEEFGNVPGRIGEDSPLDREPLIDVIEGENEISIIAELPGIEKKDINLSATEDSLRIIVDTPDRKYRKELTLPTRVKPDTTNASYKNGVLEVKLKRAEPKKKDEVRINIK